MQHSSLTEIFAPKSFHLTKFVQGIRIECRLTAFLSTFYNGLVRPHTVVDKFLVIESYYADQTNVLLFRFNI